MRKYNWLLFDADNTLWDFQQSELFSFEKAFKDFHIPYKANYLEVYHKINHQCWSDFEKGLLSQEKLRTVRMELLLKELNIDADFVAFSQSYQQNLANTAFMIDGARALLEDLSKEFTLVMITNGLKEIQRGRLKNTAIEPFFQSIVISDEIGTAKPQKAFFDYTFEQMQHDNKADVLVIGDSLSSDIKGGNDYGVDTCWFNIFAKDKDAEIVPTYEIEDLGELRGIVGIGG